MDTNVVLSALVFAQGRIAPLRSVWRYGRCRPLISKFTVTELMRALAYPKFKLSPTEQKELLADYLPYCTTVRMPSEPPKTPHCQDPYDIAFLQLAIVGSAQHLVTGDKELLSIADRVSYSIITPARLLDLVCAD